MVFRYVFAGVLILTLPLSAFAEEILPAKLHLVRILSAGGMPYAYDLAWIPQHCKLRCEGKTLAECESCGSESAHISGDDKTVPQKILVYRIDKRQNELYKQCERLQPQLAAQLVSDNNFVRSYRISSFNALSANIKWQQFANGQSFKIDSFSTSAFGKLN